MVYKERKKKKITEGGIYGRERGFAWENRMSGKRCAKFMLDKEKLQKDRQEILKKNNFFD